jgi:pimeloyl-ACP methyl ester carboxylesterase
MRRVGPTAPEWRTARLDHDGESLYYEVSGEPAAQTVVLTHGAGGTHASWFQQVPALTAAGYRVVTWDSRGFGNSTCRSGVVGADVAAGDLAAILDAVGVEAVDLVGQSMGGWWVSAFTIAHSDRVRSLTLANTIGGGLLHWRRVGAGGQGGGMSSRRCRPVSVVPCSAFKGFRFPPEIIVLAARWYLRYGLSYRDLEELLAERGIDVDHVTVFRWVQCFTPLLADAARPCRHAVGNRWFVDETYVKVAGSWRYVYRAVDQHGHIIDVYVSARRDTRAARRFFETALGVHGEPVEVVTELQRYWP